MSDSEATRPYNWFSIRSWAGSQDRAFEELCYQLRDASEPGWQTVKTAAPDGGVEWYDKAADGRCHGHQVKYVHDIANLLQQARKSLAAVGRNRRDRNVVRMTFWVPIDLPDPAYRINDKLVEGARKRWDDAVVRWKRELEGTSDIEIDLVDSGQLLERLTEPGNEGRRWFFFEQHALGFEWLREKLQAAESIAHDRYTPQHHVPLPVASVVDGCAVSSVFLARLRRLADAALKAVSGIAPLEQAQPSGLAEDEARSFAQEHATLLSYLERAQRSAVELQAAVYEASAAVMPAAAMAEAAAEIRGLLSHARQAGQLVADLGDRAERRSRPQPGTDPQVRKGWTQGDVYRVEAAAREVGRLESLCRSDAGLAAEAKVWVLLGEAGQGKTHLLVDATKRALAESRPSVTVFGDHLRAVDPLTQIAAQLGLGFLSHRAFLQAMDAAGALCGARFTLIIDALNDSDHPGGWRSALPALVSDAAPYEHVAVVVSCRSSLQQSVLPGDLSQRGYPVTSHPGFAGHEVEGLEKYLQKAPSALPCTPLLTPAFSNPLFVKLYSDSLLSVPAARREVGSAPHRSAVFDAFLDKRAGQIDTHLGLDPFQRSVHRAVQELASFMAAQGAEVVPREQARSLVDPFAPASLSWPNTMLGQLVAHGVLATDRYVHANGRWEDGIGFAYQAFSDDRIVRAALDRHQEELAAGASVGRLEAGSPLHAWLTAAPANLVDAATVLLPETVGRELIDLLHPDDVTAAPTAAASSQRRLLRSLVHTLGLREAGHVTERTVELLHHAAQAFKMEDDVLEARLTVTAQPGHRLNADRLHRDLAALSPAERDVWWGMGVYSMLEDTSALHRLLRWAEQLPTPVDALPRPQSTARWAVRRPGMPQPSRPAVPEPPAQEVVRLAAVTLAWTLTSPNRFLRDRATKALVQLLLGFPAVLTGLVERFLKHDAQQVDDPYVFERLVLVAYGVLARTRAHHSRPELLQHVARTLLECVYGDRDHAAHASKNALLCGAAGRVVKMAHRSQLVTDLEEARTHHPHPCPAPGGAPEQDVIDAQYPDQGAGEGPGWGSLRGSLSELADFVSYVIRPAVDHFSQLPLTTPMPAPAGSEPLPADALRAFCDSLPEAVRDVLGSPEGVRRLLRETRQAEQCLDEEQRRLLRACRPVPTPEQQLAAACVDKLWAARWILHNAAQRGWSPEKFGQFDTWHGRGRGREGRKAERFGKKYQWLALHELVERLANHQHMKPGPHAGFASYPGPDQLLLIDIDPTLPPAAHPLSALEDDERDDDRLATFPSTALDGCWNPPAPLLPGHDGLDDWIVGTEQLPDLNRLGLRTIDATQWVVLNEYASDHTPGTEWSGQAEQWHLLHSWLVQTSHFPQVLAFLADKTLMGRWMPEPREWHGVLLADLPLPEGEDARHEMQFVDYGAADEQQEPSAPREAAPPQSDADLARADEEVAELLLQYTTGRRPQRQLTREDRLENLQKLANRWSAAPALRPVPQRTGSPRIARTADGTALQAIPASQEYSWSTGGHDCSLDAHAHVNLPCARLLAGTDLQRHPDNGHWYTPDGQVVVRALHGYRPTGSVKTLLVRHDWLQQRLQALDMCLVMGLFGERQPRSTDRLRTWREYSQTGGLQPQGDLKATAHITTVHHRTDE